MPRFPHRLNKPPSHMSVAELAAFGVLGVSVTVGLLQMGSSAISAYRQNNNEESSSHLSSAACPMNWGKKGD